MDVCFLLSFFIQLVSLSNWWEELDLVSQIIFFSRINLEISETGDALDLATHFIRSEGRSVLFIELEMSDTYQTPTKCQYAFINIMRSIYTATHQSWKIWVVVIVGKVSIAILLKRAFQEDH